MYFVLAIVPALDEKFVLLRPVSPIFDPNAVHLLSLLPSAFEP
jgi:hypothetical protein